MTILITTCRAVAFAFLLSATVAVPVLADITDLLDMSEQLDKVEQQDFSAALASGAACTTSRDFACAEAQLALASRSVGGSRDTKTLAAAREGLRLERVALALEQQRAAEEAKRQQVAAARAAAERRAEAARAEEANSFQWGKAAALMTGATIGGLGKLSGEAQTQVIIGIAKDSMGGQEGMDNTLQASKEVQVDLNNRRLEQARVAQLRARQQAEQQARQEAEQQAKQQIKQRAGQPGKQQSPTLVASGTAGRQAATATKGTPPPGASKQPPAAAKDPKSQLTAGDAVQPRPARLDNRSLTSVFDIAVLQPPSNATGTDALNVSWEKESIACLDYKPELVEVPGGACKQEVLRFKRIACKPSWLGSPEIMNYVSCLASHSSGDYKAYYLKLGNLLRQDAKKWQQ